MSKFDPQTVKVRSAVDIAGEAENLRSVLDVHLPYVDIVNIFEVGLKRIYPEYQARIDERADSNTPEGVTTSNPIAISIRRDVIQRANEGDGRARFTIAHEIGHAIMHASTASAPMARMSNVSQYRVSRARLGHARDGEWQADEFASCFLAPSRLVAERETIEEIERDFGLSNEAANIRREKSQHLKRREISEETRRKIEIIRRNATLRPLNPYCIE